MSRNPSVSLTGHHPKFVAGLVESGRYHGVSEVFRAGLRLLEEHEEQSAALIRCIEASVRTGLGSGPPEPMEPMEPMASSIAEARAGIDARDP